MSIQLVTREYTIDLTEPESDRWNEVIRRDGRSAIEVIRGVTRDFLRYTDCQKFLQK